MEMLRETFFMKGFITAMVIAVLTKVIVWANYHRLLVSSEEMERPKRYWIGTLKKKIENYYNLQTKVNNISCIVDKYFEGEISNLYFAGDGAGLTRGLAQAGANGVWVARAIINKIKGDN